MRPTWIVLGLVVGLGAVAYVKVKSKADGASALARPADAGHAPAGPAGAPVAGPAAGTGVAGSPAAGAPPAAPSGPETRAAEVRARIAALEANKDAAGVAALEAEL